MKKRAMFGVGASMAAVLLTSSSVFAAGGLDYAKSLGQVDMGDTVNYVVEATSDGGYVAGGQTIQCFKVANGGDRGGSWLFESGEVAPMEECIEYKSIPQARGDDTADYVVDFYEYCENPRATSVYESSYSLKGGSVMRLSDFDESAYYDFSCVDYIAKFKQDGTKEWLTTIKDTAMPVAVGETSTDYRLLTKDGSLYTFAKTSGDESLSTSIEIGGIEDAIINNNGTITAAAQGDFVLIGTNGQIANTLETTLSSSEIDVYGTPFFNLPFAKPLVRSKNGFITVHMVQELETNDETGDSVVVGGFYNIVEISTDLNTITPIVEMSIEEAMEAEEVMVPLSSDQDGNILALVLSVDSDMEELNLASINKDGEVTATRGLEDIVSNYAAADDDSEIPLVLDNFMAVDPAGGRLIHISPKLEISETYELSDGEMIYDAVALNDGSMVAVGLAQSSTDNYTVDGGMNGTYLRIITAKAPNNSANPNTGDDTMLYAVGGGVMLLATSGAAILLGKRR